MFEIIASYLCQHKTPTWSTDVSVCTHIQSYAVVNCSILMLFFFPGSGGLRCGHCGLMWESCSKIMAATHLLQERRTLPCLLLLLLGAVLPGWGFNLETKEAIVFPDPYAGTRGRQTYFGFSVALQHGPDSNWYVWYYYFFECWNLRKFEFS